MFLSIEVKGQESSLEQFVSDFNQGTPQDFLDFIKGTSNQHPIDLDCGMMHGSKIQNDTFVLKIIRPDNKYIVDQGFFSALSKEYPELLISVQYYSVESELVGGLHLAGGELSAAFELIGKEDVCDAFISYILATKPYEEISLSKEFIECTSRVVERNASQSYPAHSQRYILDTFSLNFKERSVALQLLFDEVDDYYAGYDIDLKLNNSDFVLIENCIRLKNDEINYQLWEVLDRAPVEEFVELVPLYWSLLHS